MYAAAPPRGSRWDRFHRIASAVANHYKISIEDLRGPRKYAMLSMPRRMAALLMRETGASLTEIARFMHRDHATILYALRKVVGEDVPESLRAALTIDGGCDRCRGLLVELAALKLEIMELQARSRGCG